MNCQEAIGLMDGYLDGELDAITNQEVERHLRDCSKCAKLYELEQNLIRTVESSARYYRAPVDLRQAIQSSLRAEISTQPLRSISEDRSPRSFSRKSQSPSVTFSPQWSWLALAAAIITAAIVAFNIVPRWQGSRADRFLATELIASHVRSLMASHLSDVASSDQHTVKPWLDTKLDFAPPVPDLSNKGFPLIGGRLDYLDNRPVAALIYQRRKHFINLFVWPVDSNAAKGTETISRQGYQLLHWVNSDFNYWAVSDVSVGDLQAFKQSFEQQVPPH